MIEPPDIFKPAHPLSKQLQNILAKQPVTI